jgi:hypothetical protein
MYVRGGSNIRMNLTEIGFNNLNWSGLAQYRITRWAHGVSVVEPLCLMAT